MHPIRIIKLAGGIAVLMATMTSPLAVASDVYRWVDDKGVTQFGERPPMGNEGSAKLVIKGDSSNRRTNTSPLPVSGSEKPAAKPAPAAANAKATPVAAESKTAEEISADELQAKVKALNCNRAKETLKVLEENSRVRVKNDKGEYEYLTAPQHEERKETAKKVMESNCS